MSELRYGALLYIHIYVVCCLYLWVQELLEVYLIDLNGQITQLKNMMGSIHHAEDKLEMQLDIMENKVLHILQFTY